VLVTESLPRFAISDGYATYRGPTAGGGPLHRHAAFQIAIARRDDVAMVDAAGTEHRAAALVVAPMSRHRILASTDLLIYYVEPHCVFADTLRVRHGSGVTDAPELVGLRESDIEGAGLHASDDLDPRLVEALNLLGAKSIPIPTLAETVGLSPSACAQSRDVSWAYRWPGGGCGRGCVARRRRCRRVSRWRMRRSRRASLTRRTSPARCGR
jgi:hypothetical protein